MGKKVFFHLMDFVLGLFLLIPVTFAVMGSLAIRIHPEQSTFIQWTGLFLPVLCGVNLFFAFFWFWRKKWLWMSFQAVAIIFSIPHFPSVFQFPNSPEKTTGVELKVGSYNLRFSDSFLYDEDLLNVVKISQEKGTDIFCLQEFPDDDEEQEVAIRELSRVFPYHEIVASSRKGLYVAVFSKYPILKAEQVVFDNQSNNTTMWVDINIEGQTIRLFNAHLQTTTLRQIRFDGIPHIVSNIVKLRDVLNQNWRIRGSQADHIRKLMDKSPYPLLVCGDFNDTPFSYVYEKIHNGLQDSFRECGSGYGYTYQYLKKMLRIDYIFYSPEIFQGIDYDSPALPISDHKPVFVTLQFKTEPY